MIKEARLLPGPGFRPWQSLLYYGMRLIPNYPMRRAVAWTLAHTGGAAAPGMRRAADEAQLAHLRREGILRLPPLLSSAQLADVHEYLRDRRAVTPAGAAFRLADAPADARFLSYPLETIVECPHLLEAANRPDALALASAYLGGRPLISATRIDGTFPADDDPVYVQRFHRDYDDWRFLKLFIYLTDSSHENGPHEFVRSSHRHSGQLRANFFSPAQIARRYGDDAIARVCGPAGTTFVADTWGIHRGSVPTRGLRLLFQVTYSLRPTYRFEYHPVPTRRAALFDRRINRLLMTRAA